MKLIYIAGPYRGASEYHVLQNIRRAEELAVSVWKLGMACICPHKNTAFLGGVVPDSAWLEGDLEMVRRCDAVLCTTGWESSIGAKGEVAFATKHGIPVLFTLDELREWAASGQVACQTV